MGYVEDSLGADEEIKHVFELHWSEMAMVYMLYILGAALVSFGAVFWGGFLLLSAVSYHQYIRGIEQAVTSKRVILKEGIITQKTQEILLSKIEAIKVERVDSFGRIKITGTGGSTLTFRHIKDPLDVKKKIEELL